MTCFKLEKWGSISGQLSEVCSTHIKCRNIKKQACGSMKSIDKKEAGALWSKHSEGVKCWCSKYRGTLRGSMATCLNKKQQGRIKIVVQMIRWVNKKWWRKGKRQYFGQFNVKKLIKVNENIEEWSRALRLHRATSGNTNKWEITK